MTLFIIWLVSADWETQMSSTAAGEDGGVQPCWQLPGEALKVSLGGVKETIPYREVKLLKNVTVAVTCDTNI